MKKRGNRLGFLFFKAVLKTGGLRPAYGFLYFVSGNTSYLPTCPFTTC